MSGECDLFETEAQRMMPQACATEHHDSALRKIPIYERFPQYLPSVGRRSSLYGMLVIAESHYLPKSSTIHLSTDRWYSASIQDLSQEEQHWTRTRAIVNSGHNQRWPAPAHRIYNTLERAMIESGLPRSANMFQYVTFMNAFQRPAQDGDSLNVEDRDVAVAQETINGVIRELGARSVCFVSSKAHLAIGHLLRPAGVHVSAATHPASQWWHRQSQHGTGKQRFIDFVMRSIEDERSDAPFGRPVDDAVTGSSEHGRAGE